MSTNWQDPSLCWSLRPIQVCLLFLISQDFRNFWGHGRGRGWGIRGRSVHATCPMPSHIPPTPASHRSSFCRLAYSPYLSCMCSHVHVCCDVWKYVSLCLSSLMCHRWDYSEFPFCPYMGSSHITFTKPLFFIREAFPDCMSPPTTSCPPDLHLSEGRGGWQKAFG